ncbi:hypothetical protein GALMADRAFT_231359 [Galerina marginata CBS 339.88]|uniref:Uncharacterized protein n=1 Tax=Galerina marginata (strain CBS 339.88) TaxID=685588 RepID=A0A067SL09_GALM3|nr:hypothetical protein GALMADRAFT_231359 [Galerina marginata CBS 339.88]
MSLEPILPPVVETAPTVQLRPEHRRADTSATAVHQGVSSSASEKSHDQEGDKTPLDHGIRWGDILLLAGITIMLVWPWIFFGVLWAKNGIPLNNRFARVVTDNPRTTNYFVTIIAIVINAIIGILFSKAVLRFAQEWMVPKPSVTIFHVSLISAFMNRKFLMPHGLRDTYLLERKRWLRVVLVVVCVLTFTNVTSGVTSLITPFPFNRMASLRGSELNFSSTATECLDWLNAHPIPNDCNWETFNDLNYTTCLGENQIVDVLESGRGNILSLLSENSQSLTFSQLGAKDGLQFLGPIRGVLPIGPDGVPAFDTLGPSPLSDRNIRARMLSYNYTLEHQGVSSNISCQYDTKTPVLNWPVVGDSTGSGLQFNGTCNGTADVLMNVKTYTSVNSNHGLTFWACKSLMDAGQEPTYFIYLRGNVGYQPIGNINCTVSPIQPAVFPVTYQSKTGRFSLMKPVATFATTFSGYVEQGLVALGGLIAEGQNQQSNVVAESIITFGVKSFKLPVNEQNPEYLKLSEAMIQGILEYEATYTRLLYSTIADRPSSCDRTVNGSVTYSLLGWSGEPEHIGFLMPMTIVNLAALLLILLVIYQASQGSIEDDPTDPRIIALAQLRVEDGGWADRVTYRNQMSLQDNTAPSTLVTQVQ